MQWLLFLGTVLLLFSVLFFFAPHVLVKLSELGNKLVFTDHTSVAHRKLSGTVLLITGLLMFYLGLRL